MTGNPNVPEGWRVVRLEEVAEVVMGQSPLGELVIDWDGTAGYANGLPFIQGNAEFGSKSPNPLKWCTHPLKVGVPGDILISVRAPVGETNKADRSLGIGRGLAAVRFKESSHAFGWHVLNHAKGGLERVGQGSTFQAVGGGELRSLPILLPPLKEQRAIAAVLDSIDDAIERTDAVIAATEQLRDSLLHELLTRGVPGWHTAWRDIPGLGTIPADWDVVKLGEVAEVAFSSVDKKTIEGESPVRLCNYTDVFYNRRIRPEMAFMVATTTPQERERWNLRRGDVLFTKDSETPDEIGIPAFVEADMPDVVCGYHLGVARPNAELLHGAYLSEALGSPKLAIQFARIANGVTRFGLTLGATNQLPIPLPSLAEQEAVATSLDRVDATLAQLRRERDGLQSLKSSTADALLIGRIRVGG